VEEGLILTRFASKVILIHRRDQLRASKLHQQRAFANQKMEFLWDTVAEEIIGDDKVKGLSLRNVKTGEKSTLEVSGVFIYVGLHPNTEFLRGLLRLDAQGHIVINEEMQTEIAGIFAAGDIRQNSPRQVITAAGDGATASLSAEKFLSEQR
jgi:thioredoxin reductase (NADPH)